jgi:AmmeMemoRadiSam system protein B
LVDELLSEARRAPLVPQALVVPHAGYGYSGPVAAAAYTLLSKLSPKPARVVLLGPAHHVALRGLALPDCEAMASPLGEVQIDRAGAQVAAAFSQVEISAAAHGAEHSLEVQLPFLQRVLGDFSLVPLVVGVARAREVQEVLDALWSGPLTLVVISTDLSHYHDSETCRALDEQTAQRILAFDVAHLGGERACGAHALGGFLLAAKERGLEGHLLELKNSGDTGGDRARVVGYGAFAFSAQRHVS